LNSTDTDGNLVAIENIANRAKKDPKVLDIITQEGFEDLLPLFFKTKGHKFLIHICNIIASIPLSNPFRKKLTTSQMITNLMESYLHSKITLSTAALEALINLSRKNQSLPLILQLLASSEPKIHEKEKHKLKQTAVMFNIITEPEDSVITAPKPVPTTEFLEKISHNQLTPSVFLGCTDDQLLLFLPLLVKHTLNVKPNQKYIRHWISFLHRIQLSPHMGAYYYWLASTEGVFQSGGKNVCIFIFLENFS